MLQCQLTRLASLLGGQKLTSDIIHPFVLVLVIALLRIHHVIFVSPPARLIVASEPVSTSQRIRDRVSSSVSLPVIIRCRT